jgi:hypothetical protein
MIIGYSRLLKKLAIMIDFSLTHKIAFEIIHMTFWEIPGGEGTK